MNILVHRNVDIQNSFWIISEVELVRSLNELGHRAILVGMCMDNQGSPPAFIKLIKAPFGRARLYRFKMLFLLPYLVIKEKADVVIVDPLSAYSIILLGVLNFFIHKNILLDVRTIPVEADAEFEKAYLRYTRIFNKFIQGGIFITEGTKDYFIKKYNFSCKNIFIRPSGVNTNLFDPARSNHLPESFLKRIENRFILFYHGSISANRGINHILDAISKVKNIIPQLLFISVSNNNKFIVDYCIQHNLQITPHLFLISSVDNFLIPGYINKADVCIIPLPKITWWEISSPLKLFEYLAMNKPILLSRIKAHLDVVPPDADYAFYYDPDKPEEIPDKLLEAFSFCQCKSVKFESRSMVKEKYEWDKQARNLLSFIKKVSEN